MSDDTMISVRLPRDLLVAMKEQAERNGLSMSAWLREIAEVDIAKPVVINAHLTTNAPEPGTRAAIIAEIAKIPRGATYSIDADAMKILLGRDEEGAAR